MWKGILSIPDFSSSNGCCKPFFSQLQFTEE